MHDASVGHDLSPSERLIDRRHPCVSLALHAGLGLRRTPIGPNANFAGDSRSHFVQGTAASDPTLALVARPKSTLDQGRACAERAPGTGRAACRFQSPGEALLRDAPREDHSWLRSAPESLGLINGRSKTARSSTEPRFNPPRRTPGCFCDPVCTASCWPEAANSPAVSRFYELQLYPEGRFLASLRGTAQQVVRWARLCREEFATEIALRVLQ